MPLGRGNDHDAVAAIAGGVMQHAHHPDLRDLMQNSRNRLRADIQDHLPTGLQRLLEKAAIGCPRIVKTAGNEAERIVETPNIARVIGFGIARVDIAVRHPVGHQ